MKLWKLKLKNYIGIYNGMGINTIAIDFAKCKNDIVVIKGDNGSGKSTIFKSLNPFSDSSYNLIPGKAASKYIAYRLDNGDILHITYTYPVNDRGDRQTSKCSVKLQTETEYKELNPNLNINEGKAIICRLLDIDSGFLTLAQLSSDDRGLADKTPYERKKFINAKISELDAYNDIYKKLTKKSTELKGTVNSLVNKISAIGDIRSIQQNLNIAENNLADLEEKKIVLIADMSKNRTLYNDIAAKYNDPVKTHREIQDNINNIKAEITAIGEFDEALASQLETAIKDEAFVETSRQQLESINESIIKLADKKYKISNQIVQKKDKLESIGNSELLSQITASLNELYNLQEMLKEKLSSLPETVLSLTEEEYSSALDAAQKISIQKTKIEEDYSFGVINDSIESISGKTPFDNSDYLSKINSLRKAIDHYDKAIMRENSYREQAELYDKIPVTCNNKNSCPFISNIVEAKNKMMNNFEYNQLITQKEEYEKMESDFEDRMEYNGNITGCIGLLNNILALAKAFKGPLTKFNTGINYDTDGSILKSIMGTNILINEDMYLDCQNSFASLKAVEKDIFELNQRKAMLNSDQSLVDLLTNDINDLNSQINEIEKEISDLRTKNSSITNSIRIAEEEANSIRIAAAKLAEYTEKNNELKEKEKEMNAIDEAYSKAMEYDNELHDLQERLNNIYDDIKKVKRAIEENKYKTILYNDYTQEYQKYSAEYDKYETIRYYCSPTTGIQTVFMEMYMNSIIGISNQLLSMFFRGEYILQPFVVNEKEFRMPVLGSGILNDDISSMSTSQICMISMILSFALLHQSSSIYNIIKIDELEGGLDTQNRLNFFNVLSSLMSQLQFEQCVMISHNTELNMNNMDVIILKNTDPDFIREGNIIFDLQEALK